MQYVGAYVVQGPAEALHVVLAKLEKEKVIDRASPDLFVQTYRSFGIDDAHDIRARAHTRPVAGEHRVFVLAIPTLTTEAQNALLKTLEEPAAHALFFLIVPSPQLLLPTIRSRVQFMMVDDGHAESIVDTAEFLAASPDERIKMLKPLYDHDDDGRDMGVVLTFLHSLESRFAACPRTPEVRAGIDALYRAEKYAGDKGSLLKTLLEQVALLSPRL